MCLDREALTSFGPTALEDLAAGAPAHASQETMDAGATLLLRLISSFRHNLRRKGTETSNSYRPRWATDVDHQTNSGFDYATSGIIWQGLDPATN